LKKLLSHKAVRIGIEAMDIYLTHRASRSAAQLAYFLILSVFPLLICVNAFIGLLELDISAILQAAADFLPYDSLEILEEYITYITTNQSHALLWAGVAMTLFSAASAFRALVQIMEEIYDCKGAQGGIRQFISSLLFSILFLATIYLSLAVLLTGGWLFQHIEQMVPVGTVALPWAWQWLRFIILFCLVLVFVLLAYRLAAPHGTSAQPPILLGGLISALALVVFSGLFSWFIGLSSRYSLIYGSLASIIILLVWLYLCGNILIFGCIINYIRYRHKRV